MLLTTLQERLQTLTASSRCFSRSAFIDVATELPLLDADTSELDVPTWLRLPLEPALVGYTHNSAFHIKLHKPQVCSISIKGGKLVT